MGKKKNIKVKKRIKRVRGEKHRGGAKYKQGKPTHFTKKPSEDYEVLLERFDYEEAFPQKVLRELNKDFEFEDLTDRKDLTKDNIITIDGDTAKDFDDAISLTYEKGVYVLSVHIADVGHYVRPGSVIDQNAYSRGTSVYLIDRVIPMLPFKLSNDLCSLVEGKPRLTMTCEMKINKKGDILNYTFYHSTILNKKRCTYKEVQRVIDGDLSLGKEIDGLIKSANDLKKILYLKRMRDGSVDLDHKESVFELDGEGEVSAVYLKDRIESERLIEEFMLVANQCTANLFETKKTGIFRVHESPKEDRLKELIARFKKRGYEMSTQGSMNPLEKKGKNRLQVFLDNVQGQELKELMSFQVLTSFNQAVYSDNNVGHYGLAFRQYSHFTSPIRRYPDLVAHRIVKRIIEDEKPEYSQTQITSISRSSSILERKAVDAEREYYKIKSIRYLGHRIGDEFDCIVTGMIEKGLFIKHKETGIEGFLDGRFFSLKMSPFDQEMYFIDENGQRIEIGDKIQAKLVSVNHRRLFIDFKPVN